MIGGGSIFSTALSSFSASAGADTSTIPAPAIEQQFEFQGNLFASHSVWVGVSNGWSRICSFSMPSFCEHASFPMFTSHLGVLVPCFLCFHSSAVTAETQGLGTSFGGAVALVSESLQGVLGVLTLKVGWRKSAFLWHLFPKVFIVCTPFLFHLTFGVLVVVLHEVERESMDSE